VETHVWGNWNMRGGTEEKEVVPRTKPGNLRKASTIFFSFSFFSGTGV
jgi:hypothetical protein